MSVTDEAKALARRFVDTVNTRRLEQFSRVFAAHAKLTFSGTRMACDPRAARQLAKGWLAVFPDWHINLLDVVAEEDKVVLRIRWTGTQAAPVLDLPVTGRVVEVDEMIVFRIAGGLVVEGWEIWDEATMRRQLTE